MVPIGLKQMDIVGPVHAITLGNGLEKMIFATIVLCVRPIQVSNPIMAYQKKPGHQQRRFGKPDVRLKYMRHIQRCLFAEGCADKMGK